MVKREKHRLWSFGTLSQMLFSRDYPRTPSLCSVIINMIIIALSKVKVVFSLFGVNNFRLQFTMNNFEIHAAMIKGTNNCVALKLFCSELYRSRLHISCLYMNRKWRGIRENIFKYDYKQLYFGLTLIKYGMEFKFIILRFEAN